MLKPLYLTDHQIFLLWIRGNMYYCCGKRQTYNELKKLLRVQKFKKEERHLDIF